jgi:hypothetical protein
MECGLHCTKSGQEEKLGDRWKCAAVPKENVDVIGPNRADSAQLFPELYCLDFFRYTEFASGCGVKRSPHILRHPIQ